MFAEPKGNGLEHAGSTFAEQNCSEHPRSLLTVNEQSISGLKWVQNTKFSYKFRQIGTLNSHWWSVYVPETH